MGWVRGGVKVRRRWRRRRREAGVVWTIAKEKEGRVMRCEVGGGVWVQE